MSLGFDFCLERLGEMKVMKWSLISSTMDPLVMLLSLLFVRMWSIWDGIEFWILVARKLVTRKPELEILERYVEEWLLESRLKRLILESRNT